ncbi:MAG: hypothetical protein RMK79_13720, partial [Anaerolineae bacterium]|nr:hypothetical protein [Anaerolineae bacterium]
VVFLDDDVIATPELLDRHQATQFQYDKALVVGRLVTRLPAQSDLFARVYLSSESGDLAQYIDDQGRLPGTFCLTGNLSARKTTLELLGLFTEDLLGFGSGWSRWEDVELGWRADKAGIPIIYDSKAVGYHLDCAIVSLDAWCRRMVAISLTAPWLFARHPDLQPHLPMFRDKTPIDLAADPPALVVRKLLRMVASSRPAVWGMEQLVHQFERHFPQPWLLRPLYRWIIGAYIFRGYREGLRRLRKSQQ